MKSTQKIKRVHVNRKTLLIYCGIVLVIALSIFNILFYSTTAREGVLGMHLEVDTINRLNHEKLFWENFLSKNPGYIYGWIELAKTQIQLENIPGALWALAQAKIVNPNSLSIKELETQMNLNY